MAKVLWEVIVQNIGCTHKGYNKGEALNVYYDAVQDSTIGYGRGAHENVDLLRNGEPYCQYVYGEPATKMVERKKREPKPKKTPLPEEIWVMYYACHNALGSINHVSPGEKFYASEEECQSAIDNMKGWIGMGDRDRYRPMKLIKG